MALRQEGFLYGIRGGSCRMGEPGQVSRFDVVQEAHPSNSRDSKCYDRNCTQGKEWGNYIVGRAHGGILGPGPL